MAYDGVAALIDGLPERYLGDGLLSSGVRYRLKVGSISRDVVVSSGACRVEYPRGRADAQIHTDANTWRDIDAGRLSGVEAFASGRLWVRGSIDLSLRFEPMFARLDGGGLRYALERYELGGLSIAALVAGDRGADPLVLIHGLGASKASWLPIVPQLAGRYRILAVDLPGFGGSSKPFGRYDAAWFADHVFGVMDELGYDSAHVAGNSMGGRVSLEMAMRDPARIRGMSLLCPAAAFGYRPGLWLARALRPEFGVLAGRLPRGRLRAGLRQLFYDPGRIDDAWYEAAVDDFLHTWKSPRARLAFAGALKNIYMEEPYGENGFWARLAACDVPALFVYGRHDVLITHRFATKVRKVLPSATVVTWADCGHAPQIEVPERTAREMLDFFGRLSRQRSAG